MPSLTYRELDDVQRPALRLLEALGYTALTPQEANALRDGITGEVLLRGVLDEKLRDLNAITYKGRRYPFSDGNIHEAIETLRRLPGGGLVHTNEAAYHRLMLGTSLTQEIEGDRKSHPLRYIDWENPARNAFHVVPEFAVRGRAAEKRADLVLFVNGIPLGVIECKRRDKKDAVKAGIRQLLGYQAPRHVPQLFHYAHLLVAAQPNAVKYGTVGTPERFWSIWKEQGAGEAEAAVQALLKDAGEARLPTAMDRTLWALCRPERLLDLARRFVVFDGGQKKIARYQQYFAVRKTMRRVRQRGGATGTRKGGVIYHTQGSGKSLTMVMLAQALALADDIAGARVLIVTDRKSLHKQITATLRHCGKEVTSAQSGAHLARLVEDDRKEVVTTTVHKFKTAAEREGARNEGENIFVMVDEGHRTQYGSLHAMMRKALPRACYLAFTGTPLMKGDEERDTLRTFGGIIDPYPMRQAVEDGYVVPLLYEGRVPQQHVYAKPLDRGFDRVAEPLSGEQTKTLKQKATRKERLRGTQHTVEEVVYDIIEHYARHWQGTGFKAQLTMPSKEAAIQAHRLVQEDGRVRSAVVISAPDEREGEGDGGGTALVQAFWQEEVAGPFGDEEAYEAYVLDRFHEFDKDDPGVELLIVVDKLLTGFDAPRNTVLYINRPLKEHSLLQAVARVNRLHEGKEFGYIMDYEGVLGELDKALATYGALSGFDGEALERDLASALQSVRAEVDRLGQRHTDLVRTFDEVDDRTDKEALERFLKAEDRRDIFYERLAAFLKALRVARSTQYYHGEEHFPKAIRERYRRDAKFYVELRRAVQLRYEGGIDFSRYERRVKELLDQHVIVDEVEQVTKAFNIFDTEELEREVERVEGETAASKADRIAHRTKKELSAHMDEDPVLFKKLSELIQEAIDDFHQRRIDEQAYLRRVLDLQRQAEGKGTADVPGALQGHPEAIAYFNALDEELGSEEVALSRERLAEAGLRLQEIIEEHKIIDWRRNADVAKRMEDALDDYLIDSGLVDLSEGTERLDRVLRQVIDIAKSRGEQ